MKLSAAILLAAALSACARIPGHGSQAAILDALTNDLRFEYHACVPLGWAPVPVAGSYYPGYVVSVSTYEEFLDAIWRGRIDAASVDEPEVKPVFEVLNHLVSARLLRRKRNGAAYQYFLTAQALPYYYDASIFKNNRGNIQYLCYSKILPDRIVWIQRIAAPKNWSKAHAQWYRVAFTWRPGTIAAWGSADAFLRRHSVILPPVESPTEAKIYYANGDWRVVNLYERNWMLPALTDAAAWLPGSAQKMTR